MIDTDVIVVGAGPAGSIAARKLAEAGVRTTLFEKSETPGKDNVCAGMLELSCARKYDVDESIFEKVIYKGVHVFDFATVELDNSEGYVMILRDRFDRYLADRAVSKGADLKTRTRVTDVKVIQKGLVEVRYQTNKCKEHTMRSRAVIIADGPHTLSSRLFPGLGFPKAPENLFFAFSCDVEAVGNSMNHFEMYYSHKLADWGYGWIFPKKDMLNFGMGCRIPEYETDKSILMRRFDYFWNEHPRASEILKNRRLIRKRGAMVPQKIASKLVQDSILVAGDAAGMADSLVAAGIQNAMYSGDWAASVLKEALQQDRLDAAFLESYEQTWRNSTYYKELLNAERFRDFGVGFDRLIPHTSNRLKYLAALWLKLANKMGYA
jgi:digeranylgeranylglycerophospholipid reductase